MGSMAGELREDESVNSLVRCCCSLFSSLLLQRLQLVFSYCRRRLLYCDCFYCHIYRKNLLLLLLVQLLLCLQLQLHLQLLLLALLQRHSTPSPLTRASTSSLEPHAAASTATSRLSQHDLRQSIFQHASHRPPQPVRGGWGGVRFGREFEQGHHSLQPALREALTPHHPPRVGSEEGEGGGAHPTREGGRESLDRPLEESRSGRLGDARGRRRRRRRGRGRGGGGFESCPRRCAELG